MGGLMWLLVAIAGGLLLLFVFYYNKLVGIRQLTKNAWADVDVYLRRRADLIPQLVEAVKGYAAYERATLENLASARTRALSAEGPSIDRQAAEGIIALGLQRTFGLVEAYPDLKTSDQFMSLQNELRETERLIASARQYYNACVRDHNTLVESFPSAVVAGMIGMKHKDYFEPESAAERDAPSVKGIGG